METMLRLFKTSDAEYVAQRDSPKHIARRAFLERCIRDRLDLRGKRGFDFGAGYGATMDALRADGAIMSGCDISPTIAAAGNGVEVGGLNVLERAPEQDFIICSMVLSLMTPDEREQFWQLCRVKLKLGGLVFFLQGSARTNPRRADLIGAPDPETFW